MALEKKSIAVMIVVLAVALIASGLVGFGLNYGNWFVPVLSMVGGLILFLEIGIKKISNLSSLKKLGVQQFITLAVAFVAIINGLVTLPPLNFQLGETLVTSASFNLILVGLAIFLELFTDN